LPLGQITALDIEHCLVILIISMNMGRVTFRGPGIHPDDYPEEHAYRGHYHSPTAQADSKKRQPFNLVFDPNPIV
jgi:hypothetical protein